MLETLFVGFVALFIALAPISASAQSNTIKSWTGCFVGFNARVTTTATELLFPWTPRRFALPDASGKTIGAQVGCDYQVASQFVIGLMLDGAIGNVGGSAVVRRWFGTVTTTINYTKTLAFSVRAGLVPTPKLLVYGRVGYAGTEGTLSSTFVSGPHTDSIAVSGAMVGPFAGVGVEYRVKQHLSFILEARKYSFASNSSTFGGGSISASPITIAAGLNWRF